MLITVDAEVVYQSSKAIDSQEPIHLEVLLPAFVLGCMMMRPAGADPHRDDALEGHQEGPDNPTELRVGTVISGAFMLLVGLSKATVFAGVDSSDAAKSHHGPVAHS